MSAFSTPYPDLPEYDRPAGFRIWASFAVVSWLFLNVFFLYLFRSQELVQGGTALTMGIGILCILTDFRAFVLAARFVLPWAALYAGVVLVSTAFNGLDILAPNAPGLITFTSTMRLLATNVSYLILLTVIGMSQKALRWTIWLIVALCLFDGSIGTLGALTGQRFLGATTTDVGIGAFGYDSQSGRSGGIHGENYVGAWQAPALAVGMTVLLANPLSPIAIGICVLSASAVAVSLSRTSAACAVITVLMALAFAALRGIRVWKFIFLGIGVWLVLWAASSVMQGQFANMTGDLRREHFSRWTTDSTLSGRDWIWTRAWDVFLDSPVIGKGVGAGLRLNHIVSHNVFLDVLADTGVIGCAVFFAPPAMFLWLIIKHLRQIARDPYLPMLVAATIGSGMVWFSLSSQYERIPWICAGLVYGRILWLREFSPESLLAPSQAQQFLFHRAEMAG